MSLCHFFHYSIKSLPGYSNKKSYIFSKGTSLCTYQKASYTIEAAILFPLVAGFFVSILFLFRILQVQHCVEEALFYAGQKTALESCLVNAEYGLSLSAKAFFLSALEEHEISKNDVIGGIWGISLANSEFSEEEILLEASYYMKLPIEFFGKQYFPITQKNIFRKWNGEYQGSGEEEDETSYVYITPNGSAYHKTSECRSLDLSVEQVNFREIEGLRGADGQKYYPCSMCSKNGSMKNIYYTKYGYLYHGDIHCSSIKRTIVKVTISEVGGKSPCKYCYISNGN